MSTRWNRRTTIASLRLQIVGCGVTTVGNFVILKTVIFIPIMLRVLRILMIVSLFISVQLQLKVLVLQLRGSDLIVKCLELDGLLGSDVRLFRSRTFTQAPKPGGGYAINFAPDRSTGVMSVDVNLIPALERALEKLEDPRQVIATAYGLPSLPEGAKFVPGKYLDYMQNKLEGHNLDGSVINHDNLPGAIADLQSTRDSLAKKGNTDPAVLKQLDGTIGSMQAKLDYLDNHKATVLQQTSQATEAGKVAGETSPSAIAGAAKKAGAVANAELPSKIALQNAKSTGELNAVAYDPNYQNPDGTKGANVVMNREDAQAKGLTHYKTDPSTINTVVAGMNDVQNKLNQLAGVVNDPKFAQVQPGIAAQMLAHGHGLSLSFGASGKGASGGIGVDTSMINEKLYQKAVNQANPATRDYVTAMVGAHEAVTQLPRLQTFGKSNRMTESQMEAAQNLLPQPGDGSMASQKMTSLQGMIDPLRKQIPHMPGAETTPSWLEQNKQQRQIIPPMRGSNLGQIVSGR